MKVGEPAPEFSLTGSDGKGHSLMDYRGKFVVLEWLNQDCPFVHKHYESGNMQRLQKTYTEQGVIWLSINSSAPGKEGHYSPEETSQLTQEKGAQPTAVLLDPEGNVGRQYTAQTTPHMFIIDPDGNLIYQGAIDDTPSTNIEDIAASRNFVDLALQAALAGLPVEFSATKSYGCSVKYGK